MVRNNVIVDETATVESIIARGIRRSGIQTDSFASAENADRDPQAPLDLLLSDVGDADERGPSDATETKSSPPSNP